MYYSFSTPTLVAFTSERRCTDANLPYDGFNITHYCGDTPEHVSRCRKQLCGELAIPDRNLVLPHQVHGTSIAEVTASNLDNAFEGIDGLITNQPDVCIGVSTADCVPLLFHDTVTGAIAAVHAGWRGTVSRIAIIALGAMYDAYGTIPLHVECVIGPSIGPDAFEVGDEVYDAFAEAGFPMNRIAKQKEKWHIDLWLANSWLLTRAGVPAHAIQMTSLCTFTHCARFFSARRLGINSGRIFTGIMRKGR